MQQMAVLRSLVWVAVLVLSLGTMITADEGGVPSLQDLENKHLLVKEILELRSQVTDLKIVVKDQDSSLKMKDKNIQVLETKLQEFQNQTKGWGDAESKLAAALTKISALEAQTSGLKVTSERLKVEQEELKRLAEKAELTAALQLSEKDKASKEVAALKSRLQKAEKALQVAESAVLKLRTEMTANAKDLAKSTNAWLPPWAAMQASKLQDMVSSRWVAHGEPAVRKVRQTLQAKASQAQKFTKPYWRSTRRFFKKKVYPVIRPGWKRLNHAMVPHLNSIQKLGTQFLDASKRKLSPFLSNIAELRSRACQRPPLVGQPMRELPDTVFSGHFTAPTFKRHMISGTAKGEKGTVLRSPSPADCLLAEVTSLLPPPPPPPAAPPEGKTREEEGSGGEKKRRIIVAYLAWILA
jgi:hypothetical protein